MLTLRNIVLPDYNSDDQQWKDFYDIFRRTLKPDLTLREFKIFYLFKKPVTLDVSFIYHDEELIGFISAAFYYYKFDFSTKRCTIARGTAGILPEHRGGSMSSFKLCSKYMWYKLTHPLEEIYITGYMANPKLYAMMCKYAHRVYPKAGIAETPFIKKLRDAILSDKHRQGEYLVKLHFKVMISRGDRESFIQSNDINIRYFLDINPNFGEELGLFTIIPLDWSNVGASLKKHLIQKLASKFDRFGPLSEPAKA